MSLTSRRVTSAQQEQGSHGHLAQLLLGQSEINNWYENESEKVKIQARIEDVETPEAITIFQSALFHFHAQTFLVFWMENIRIDGDIIDII